LQRIGLFADHHDIQVVRCAYEPMRIHRESADQRERNLRMFQNDGKFT